MSFQFIVKAWSVWPSPSSEALAPTLENIPLHLKRRLSPLASSVFAAIAGCGNLSQCPAVFSSAYGELTTSLAMLTRLDRDGEISPTAFSLSVHNAIAGLFSMMLGNTFEITVLSPGADGIAPAFVEALGLLHEGAEEVLVVFYDEPMPSFYPTQPFLMGCAQRSAVALRLSRSGEGSAMCFSKTKAASLGCQSEQPQHVARFVEFMSGAESILEINTPRQTWRWQKL
ncbi:beta-ketoacyl synthase chain length factor [Methylocucumis oryzae]|uniref:beta-ketoacyl synthase chain length factor n=1 Tax=Methylocucumis oryzae TaxID=1632867 RepID=UPI000697B116|nr:beta-ketoacyl synthase chain length factor [Methylocucumis oryzae]